MQVISAVWAFVQDQLLGMGWLYRLTGKLLSLAGLDPDSMVGGSVRFFIFDTIKILTLLSLLIFVVSFIQSYFPPERTRKVLGRFRGLTANVLAALLGPLPLLFLLVHPLFIGFTSAGLPVGVTFSFLISSPLVDLGSLVLLMSVFGAKVAVAYVLIGLVLAVIGGSMIERLGMDRYVESFVKAAGTVDIESPDLSRAERAEYAWDQVKSIFRKVFLYVLVGVGIGAVIHNWIPEDVIQAVLGNRNPFSVIIATIIGAPMYADIFGTIPIAEALFAKGVGLGTVLSFMMAVTALSAPSIIMLRRAVKPRLLVVFVGIVTVGIAIIGYLFNAFQFLLV